MRSFDAVCHLWTHVFGWEMRLEINGDLQRSEVVGLRTRCSRPGDVEETGRGRMEMMSPSLQNRNAPFEELHRPRLRRNDDLAPASRSGKCLGFVGSDMGLQQQPQSY